NGYHQNEKIKAKLDKTEQEIESVEKSKVNKSQPSQSQRRSQVALQSSSAVASLCISSGNLSSLAVGSYSDKLDWNNPKRDRYPFDLSKPLPLQGHLGHLTVAVDYFFNNDLEYLKSSDPERTHAYDKGAVKRIKHWGVRRKLWYMVKDKQEKDKIRSKPDKNEK
nr:hypothetical protein [Tanacetum cinerariifolium]